MTCPVAWRTPNVQSALDIRLSFLRAYDLSEHADNPASIDKTPGWAGTSVCWRARHHVITYKTRVIEISATAIVRVYFLPQSCDRSVVEATSETVNGNSVSCFCLGGRAAECVIIDYKLNIASPFPTLNDELELNSAVRTGSFYESKQRWTLIKHSVLVKVAIHICGNI